MLTHHSPERSDPARIVLLGARGFVASSLAGRLRAAGAEVLALASAELDLTAPDAAAALHQRLRGDDTLIFVSALTPDKGKDIRTLMRNLAMGEQVCAALAAAPPRHVVYVSSDAVYDDEAPLVDEGTARNASSYHGVMHIARERMLFQTATASRTPLAILRPSAIYGVGDTHNGYGPNRFLRTAVEQRDIALFGGGEEQRDHLYIDDFVDVIQHVIAHRSAGLVNVASGAAVSFFSVAELVQRLVGPDVTIRTSARSNPITHRHFDIAALVKSCPGFRPTPLAEGLRSMYAAATAAP
jgi:nucleoside-diphosphate-sugar epimerase